MSDLDELFDIPTDDLPEPLKIPPGTWVFSIKILKAKDDRVILGLRPHEPLADVDPTAADAYLADLEDDQLEWHSIRGNKRAISGQLRTIAEAVGVPDARHLIDADVKVVVTHREGSKGGTFVNFGNWASATEDE